MSGGADQSPRSGVEAQPCGQGVAVGQPCRHGQAVAGVGIDKRRWRQHEEESIVLARRLVGNHDVYHWGIISVDDGGRRNTRHGPGLSFPIGIGGHDTHLPPDGGLGQQQAAGRGAVDVAPDTAVGRRLPLIAQANEAIQIGQRTDRGERLVLGGVAREGERSGCGVVGLGRGVEFGAGQFAVGCPEVEAVETARVYRVVPALDRRGGVAAVDVDRQVKTGIPGMACKTQLVLRYVGAQFQRIRRFTADRYCDRIVAAVPIDEVSVPVPAADQRVVAGATHQQSATSPGNEGVVAGHAVDFGIGICVGFQRFIINRTDQCLVILVAVGETCQRCLQHIRSPYSAIGKLDARHGFRPEHQIDGTGAIADRQHQQAVAVARAGDNSHIVGADPGREADNVGFIARNYHGAGSVSLLVDRVMPAVGADEVDILAKPRLHVVVIGRPRQNIIAGRIGLVQKCVLIPHRAVGEFDSGQEGAVPAKSIQQGKAVRAVAQRQNHVIANAAPRKHDVIRRNAVAETDNVEIGCRTALIHHVPPVAPAEVIHVVAGAPVQHIVAGSARNPVVTVETIDILCDLGPHQNIVIAGTIDHLARIEVHARHRGQRGGIPDRAVEKLHLLDSMNVAFGPAGQRHAVIGVVHAQDDIRTLTRHHHVGRADPLGEQHGIDVVGAPVVVLNAVLPIVATEHIQVITRSAPKNIIVVAAVQNIVAHASRQSVVAAHAEQMAANCRSRQRIGLPIAEQGAVTHVGHRRCEIDCLTHPDNVSIGKLDEFDTRTDRIIRPRHHNAQLRRAVPCHLQRCTLFAVGIFHATPVEGKIGAGNALGQLHHVLRDEADILDQPEILAVANKRRFGSRKIYKVTCGQRIVHTLVRPDFRDVGFRLIE